MNVGAVMGDKAGMPSKVWSTSKSLSPEAIKTTFIATAKAGAMSSIESWRNDS